MRLNLAPDMGRRRAAANAQIDSYYFGLIARQVTAFDLYRRKVAEARTVIAGGEPGPLISMEVALRETSASVLAESILAEDEAATGRIVDIEQDRLTLKLRVQNAAGPAEIDAAVADIGTLRP